MRVEDPRERTNEFRQRPPSFLIYYGNLNEASSPSSRPEFSPLRADFLPLFLAVFSGNPASHPESLFHKVESQK